MEVMSIEEMQAWRRAVPTNEDEQVLKAKAELYFQDARNHLHSVLARRNEAWTSDFLRSVLEELGGLDSAW